MKQLFKNHFEETWRVIFVVLFIGIMLPLRCFVNYEYNPSLFGVPNFVWGWIVYGLFTYILIIIFYKMAMKRPEYHIYESKEGK